MTIFFRAGANLERDVLRAGEGISALPVDEFGAGLAKEALALCLDDLK